MSVYPRNLSSFLNRLSGYNKNNVKLNVLGSSSARDGDIIQVELPTNSIVDLSSLAWAFEVVYADPAGNNADLPLHAEALISRLAVEVNGQTLVNLTNYNTLFHAIYNLSATEDFQRQRQVSQTNTQDGVAPGSCKRLAAGNTETRQHVIDSWLGFLGTAKPNFIDTALLGNVRITITLAGANITNGDNGGIVRGYTIRDSQHFSIDVVSINDGVYDSMVDSLIGAGGVIEVPFKNYFHFSSQQDSMNQTTAFTVASQSIDKLWAVPRRQTYANADAAQVGIAGKARSTSGAAVGGGVAGAAHAIAVAGGGAAGDNGVGAITAEVQAFNHPHMNFESCNGTNFQFKINNTLYPSWQSQMPGEWLALSKLAIGDQGNMLSGSMIESLKQFEDNFFTFVVSLEHKTDGDERFVSGIDTRGAAAQCYFTSTQSTVAGDVVTGVAGGAAINRTVAVANQVNVFAECTSLLRIMAGKTIEIVQ